MNMLRSFFRFLLDIIYPRRCVCCGIDLPRSHEDVLCPACAAQLKHPGPLICRRCGRVLPSGGAHCFACRGSKAQDYKCKIVRSVFIFNTPVRRLVHALKYRRAVALAQYMGRQMATYLAKTPELKDVNYIVPVALHKRRFAARGFNQSEALARTVAEKLHLPLDTSSLVRLRNTASQTKLGREQRARNMQGAFSCVNSALIKGKTVLLIDDVCTTGATLEACAVALRGAGAKRVVALTYARE